MEIKKWLKDIPDYVPGKTLEEIKTKYNLEKVYKLASNENMEGPSQEVVEAICQAASRVNYYPDANCTRLREELSKVLKVGKDNLIVGNGTDQIIEMLCDCFVGNGDNIVVADPTFLIYEKTSLKCGCRVKKIPLIEYRQDIRGMVSVMDSHTKILFLTSPHNPTGTNISIEDFEYALTEAASQALLVIDEAYFEYVPEQLRLDSLSYLDRFPNLVVLRTFSKIFGLAGLRVGYGVADENIISSMNKIRLPFNVNSLGQAAAIAALRNWESVSSVRERVEKEKNKFYKKLGQNKIRYIESCANFLLIETGSQTSHIIEDLLGKGFIVRPGYNLGVDGYIRVTISVPDINDKFLDQFIKIYEKYNNQ